MAAIGKAIINYSKKKEESIGGEIICSQHGEKAIMAIISKKEEKETISNQNASSAVAWATLGRLARRGISVARKYLVFNAHQA
jgi:hypothetical protein